MLITVDHRSGSVVWRSRELAKILFTYCDYSNSVWWTSLKHSHSRYRATTCSYLSRLVQWLPFFPSVLIQLSWHRENEQIWQKCMLLLPVFLLLAPGVVPSKAGLAGPRVRFATQKMKKISVWGRIFCHCLGTASGVVQASFGMVIQ